MAVHDDVIYGGLLLISVPIGFFIKSIQASQSKQYASTAIGLSIVALICGRDTLHSLTTAIINCIILKVLGPRYCHIGSFVWCFGYIAFFRMTHYLGLPQVAPHSNAVQLLMTLKLVGLAFEIHDSYVNNKEKSKSQDEEEKNKLSLRCKYENINPSVLDMLMYSYCYIGILTGPYYKYRTYVDMLDHKNPDSIDTLTPVKKRIMAVPVCAAGFLFASLFFSIQETESDAFYERSFWYRLFFMVPMFCIFRLRFYSAWIMSECMCMSAGLGAYPKGSKAKCGRGPTDLESLDKSLSEDPSTIDYEFETVHNIDVYGCELAPTVREGMRAWNMTVQYWLANNIYRRIPIKSIRTSLTMVVSAFWHGIHPGYYLSFMTVPPCLLAEGAMATAYRDNATPEGQNIFDWICWFFKMRAFDYMCMGFLLLKWDSTLRYWSCIYFLGHVFVIMFIAIGYSQQPKVKKEKAS